MAVKFKPRDRTDKIVIHCAATKPTMDIGLREIRQWHRERGFLDVGYHFIVRRNGAVEIGREVGVIGAHVEGHNATSVGVCLVGGIDAAGKPQDNFTPEQWAALDALVWKLTEQYPGAAIVGHRMLDPKKACPSFDVPTWLKARPKDI